MSECADYTDKMTKNCSVVLERLNETLLNQYVQKYGLKLNVSSIESIANLKFCDSKSKKGTNTLQKNKSAEELVIKINLKRKKRKIKPLCDTDDEGCPIEPLRKDFWLISSTERNGVATDCPQQSRRTTKNLKSKASRDKRSKLMETGKNSESMAMELKENISNIEEEKNALTFEYNLYDSYYGSDTKGDLVLNAADSEIEIKEEFDLSSVPENENVDTTVNNCLQSDNSNNSESARGKEVSSSHLEEYDSREDSEDDKNTIIFEKGPHSVTKPEVSNVDEKEVERAPRKLTNKDITNRKKPRLIQFKRKSMKGRNSAMVRKYRKKLLETCTTGKEFTDAEVSHKGFSEDCLKEVCYVVKRLHELHQTISQEESLFRQLPNREELFVHFSKVISAKQENFQKEIRKSQKTISGCYKNLLFYLKPSEIVLEIRKRTALNVDEVTHILSECLLLEGARETEKSRNGTIENGVFQAHETSHNSDNSTENAWSGQQINYSVLPSHSYLSSEHNPGFYQEPINRPSMEYQFPGRETSVSNSQISVEHLVQNPLPPVVSMQQNIQYNTQESFWIPKNWVHKPHPQIGQPHHGLRPDHPSLVMQHYFPQHCNTQTKFYGLTYPNQSLWSSSYYPANVGVPQHSRFMVPPASFTPVRTAEFPLHIINHVPEETAINHHTHDNIYISSDESRVPIVPNGAGNIAGFNMAAPQNSLFNSVFPSRIHNTTNAESLVLTSPGETRCSLDEIFRNSESLPYVPNGLLSSQHELSLSHSNTHSAGIASEVSPEFREENVFDPSVPLKLIMRDNRLQAEANLLQTGAETSKAVDLHLGQSLEVEKIDDYGFPDSVHDDLKAKAYICAQKDCKNMGTRICKSCQSTIYCSDACQVNHWNWKHNVECNQLKQLRK